MTSCFISYGREDDEPYVKRLYNKIKKDKVQVWWDREAMESRGKSFLSVIDDAIQTVDRVLFIIGPSSLASDYVKHELSVAEEHCKIIIPALRIGDYSDVPKEMNQHTYDLSQDDPREYKNLIRELLEEPPKPARLLGELPPQPGHLINRKEEIDRIREKILADVNDPVAICGGIRATTITGMGGLGKTVLASLVASSCTVRREFSEGIIFVRFQPETDSLEVLNELRRILRLQVFPGETVSEAMSSLSAKLSVGRRLIILDNIWSIKQISDLVSINRATANRLLFTTRLRDITADLKANIYELDLLDEQKSIDFLAQWLDQDPSELPDVKSKIVERCGRLPLALSICGALLKEGTKWNDLAEGLEASEMYYLDREIPGYEYPGVFAAMDVGYKDLLKKDAGLAERFRQLVVFDQGNAVPEKVIFKLWEVKSDAEVRMARYQLTTLANRTLITLSEENSVTIHDVIFIYLSNLEEDRNALRKKIIDAFRLEGRNWSEIAGDNIWLRDNLVNYMLSFKDFTEIEKLLGEENTSSENAWYQLRSDSGEIDKYWDDLTKIGKELEWENTQISLPLATRLALMKSSILSMEKNIPTNLIITALKWGIWTPERAFIQMKRIPKKIDLLTGLTLLLHIGKMDPQIIIDDFFLQLSEITINDFGINRLKNILKDFSRILPNTSLSYTREKVYNFLLDSDEHLFNTCLEGFTSLFESEDFDKLISLVENRSLTSREDRYARAILGKLLPEGNGLRNLETLVSKVSYSTELAEIAKVSIRKEKNSAINFYILRIFNALTENADNFMNESVLELLASLPKELTEQNYVPIDAKQLPLRFSDSPLNNARNIAVCAKHVSLHSVLLDVANSMKVSYCGTGAIAALMNYAPKEMIPLYKLIINKRLEQELDRADRRSDWSWIGDVAKYYGPIFNQLSDANRVKLKGSIPKIKRITDASETIVGLSENLSKAELFEAIENLLSDLSQRSTFLEVVETLNIISPLLNPAQTNFALAVAQAARDDGFEMHNLYYLVKQLSKTAQERVHNWVIDRNFEHLNVSDNQFSKDWSIARFIREMIDTGITENILSRLEALALALKDTFYAIPAIAKVAEASEKDHSEKLWLKIDQLLDTCYPNGKPGDLLAILASTAKGKRREKYSVLALVAEDHLARIEDNIYKRTNILKELPASEEVSTRTIKLIHCSSSKSRDHVIEELISKIEPEALVELIDNNSWYFETDKTIKNVCKKLAEYGYKDTILQICYYNGDYRTIDKKYLEILYKYLPLDQVEKSLTEIPDHPDLIVRLAELKKYRNALSRAFSLKVGYQRLHTVIRCCQYLVDKALKEKYLLEAMPDLEHIDIQNELYKCIDIGGSELIKLSESARIEAYKVILGVLEKKTRLQSLPALYLSSQIVFSLIGESGVIATFNAVKDVCQWWPSYLRKNMGRSEKIIAQ